jgi:hypothetical protein
MLELSAVDTVRTSSPPNVSGFSGEVPSDSEGLVRCKPELACDVVAWTCAPTGSGRRSKTMTDPVLVACIAAVASLLGATLGALGTRSALKLQRERLDVDRQKTSGEIEKLTLETRKLAGELSSTDRARRMIEDALVEFEKRKVTNVLETRSATYPQLLEYVYRIRNQTRAIHAAASHYRDGKYTGLRRSSLGDFARAVLGDGPKDGTDFYLRGLWQLTDCLYRNKAFIDSETWESLHRFKRLSQDTEVILDRMTRDFESKAAHAVGQANEPDAMEEGFSRLDAAFLEMDSLYDTITHRVRQHLNSVILLTTGVQGDFSAVLDVQRPVVKAVLGDGTEHNT